MEDKAMDIFQLFKDVYSCAKKLEQQELLEKLMELKEKCYELRDENCELKERLAKKESYNFVFENNLYWNLKADGTREGPYCTSCWDNFGKAIRMHISLKSDLHTCPVCDSVVEGPGYQAPMPHGYRRGGLL